MRKLPQAAAGVLSVMSVMLAAACDPSGPPPLSEARKAPAPAATGTATSGAQPAGGDATADATQSEPVAPADARARDAQRHARDRGERDR